MAPDDIPHKLRCANCSKLAINAFRLPCCEQAICESCTPLSVEYFPTSVQELTQRVQTGHENLPSSCPVCEHSPLSASDCSPNKSLRTTIKVFLRTAEKKREALRLKEEKESSGQALPTHDASQPTTDSAAEEANEPSRLIPVPESQPVNQEASNSSNVSL